MLSKLVGCQLNYAFRLHLPSDLLINGLAFASVVVSRSVIYNKNKCNYYIDVSNKNSSYRPNISYIPLNYVHSTQIILSALHINTEPLREDSKNDPHFIYLLLSHPYRFGRINYSRIDEDKDGTKEFEK